MGHDRMVQTTDFSSTATPRVVSWSPEQFAARVDDAMGIYVRAMNYPGTRRRPAGGHRPAGTPAGQGFACRAALLEDGTLVGFGYGYTTAPGQWWHDLVRKALDDGQARIWLHGRVRAVRAARAADLPGQRHRPACCSPQLAAGLPHRAMLLSTPDADTRAFRLYRRLGFLDLRRQLPVPGRRAALRRPRRPPAAARRWHAEPRPAARHAPAGAAARDRGPRPARLPAARRRGPRRADTVLTVLARGRRDADRTPPRPRGAATAVALVATTVPGGLAVEVVGVHTGLPFGRYRYDSSLGPQLLHVPVIIALAWPMLAWPAALAAARLCRSYPARVLTGAVGAGRLPTCSSTRRWWPRGTGTGCDPAPHLPGVPDRAAEQLRSAGCSPHWLHVGAAATRAGPFRPCAAGPTGTDRAPLGYYLWTVRRLGARPRRVPRPAGGRGVGHAGDGTVAVPLARSRR